ncbi:hypothetical protein SOCEGT47_034730 [Sorangium cellulosum]|uniref:Secreted protein n=1 Tax=Sorangium cellulosum TaxID=56 RepID=A0A4P2Q143_SORCE|nr:hypothetical protein [Sorangium cellulosum]AUX22957.1 hypothetical protein SOCEGT47_034730 [Sorangium cellulosum]
MQAHLAAHARPADRSLSLCGRAASCAAIGVLALGSASAGAAEEPAAALRAQPARPVPPVERPPSPPPRGEERPAAAARGAPARAAAANLSTFVELRNDYITRGRGRFFNAAVLRGDYAFDRSFSLRADVPLAYAGGLEGERDVGLGDILIRPLVRVVGTPRVALLVGSDLVLDSATRPALGAGKNQIAPIVQAYVRVARAARLGLHLQHAVSFGGDPRRDAIQGSTARAFAIVELPRGLWLQPDQGFHFNHRGAPRVVSTSILEVGAALSERVQVYLDPGIQVGSQGAVDWLVTGAVRWEFPQRERRPAIAAAPPARHAVRAAGERAAGE